MNCEQADRRIYKWTIDDSRRESRVAGPPETFCLA